MMNLAKFFIVNAVAVENDSESTFLYVFNLSGLVFRVRVNINTVWVQTLYECLL